MKYGRFITFEGVEGSGKSTQAHILKERLETKGFPVCVTREPGGTPLGENIRSLLLDPANTAMSHTTELLLYAAARAQHVDEFIRPRLEAGFIVICDRFVDSTTAYQGGGRIIPDTDLAQLHRLATRGVWPDLTILLDLPARDGLARVAASRGRDRIENEPIAFHCRVRDAFLNIAEHDPHRMVTLNAAMPVEQLACEIGRLVDERLSIS